MEAPQIVQGLFFGITLSEVQLLREMGIAGVASAAMTWGIMWIYSWRAVQVVVFPGLNELNAGEKIFDGIVYTTPSVAAAVVDPAADASPGWRGKLAAYILGGGGPSESGRRLRRSDEMSADDKGLVASILEALARRNQGRTVFAGLVYVANLWAFAPLAASLSSFSQ